MSDPAQWIDAYLDGELRPEEAEAFREWLRRDPRNVDAFVRQSRLHWQLRDVLAGAGASELVRVAIRPASGFRWNQRTRLAAAAVIALCILGGILFLLARGSRPSPGGGGSDAANQTLATLTSVDHAQWSDREDRKVGRSITGHLGLSAGNAIVAFASGAEVRLTGPCDFDVVSRAAGKLSRGQLVATVPPSAKGFRIDTPSMAVVDLGTRFGLIVDLSGSSDVHVLQGRVEVSSGAKDRQQVTTGQAARAVAGGSGISRVLFDAEQFAVAAGSPSAATKPSAMPAGAEVYQERFLSLWRSLHEPKNGYFSASGLPYHSRETFMIEAPDYGHETTSEALSYWLWLEATYGHVTGDWSKLTAAWDGIERHAIPTPQDQPTNRFYNAKHPATYAPEGETPDKYPVAMRQDVPVGHDPIADELKRTYGTADVYGMHWLLDLDNWYGYGRRGDGASAPAYINTFQRGPMESVWATVTHPSWETFKYGGPRGFLDLFIRDGSYSPQWRYTTAPDADARAVEAMYWAGQWAKQRGQQDQVAAAMTKASRMGDYLRYATFDKYFKRIGARSERDAGGSGDDSAHRLIGWYYGWGGPTDPKGGWAFRIGCSHVHSGYQNPLAAWALAENDALRPKSPRAAADWRRSLSRQMEFYRWLQSAEGAIAGGATNSWNGRYESPPTGTPTFYGMAYDWEPVYHDPPSNDWFGFQAWTMCRVAELYYATGNDAATALLDKWVAWATANVALNEDGSFLVPQTLRWSGQPDSWDAAHPGPNASLHVEVVDRSADVGVAASLARTLVYYSAGRKRWAQPSPAAASLARQLLDRMWAHDRDDAGVSAPEPRPDYKRVFEQTVYVPPNWSGKMPNGDAIRPGVKFIDLRSKYRQDPAFAEVERAYRAGQAPVFRYHRFWAQVEVALANAALAELDTGGADH